MAAPRKLAPAGRYVGRPGYGDPAAERRAAIVRWALAVLMALGLAYLVSTVVARINTGYSADVTRILYGDDSVTVSWVVTKPDGAPALCVIRSRNQAGREIGRAEVPVAADVGPRDVQTFTLRTTDTPVSGEVVGCGEP